MTVTFFSTFLNHHQLPLCREFVKMFGEGFTFVETSPIPEERIKLGYKNISDDYPFAFSLYEDDRYYETAIRLAKDSNIVIMGDAPEIFLQERMKLNKLTFRYSERLYKGTVFQAFSPRTAVLNYLHHTRYKGKNLYLLAAGAYVARDYALSGAYIGKAYKWGYFPEKEILNIDAILEKKENNSILWAGRLIDWKHPEIPILLAERLRQSGFNYSLKIIGTGEMESEICRMISERNLHDSVEFIGPLSPDSVRSFMKQSSIFLFTSDKKEGWGAVLNEAMNSGCASVVNRRIGSAGYLIDDSSNGILYNCFDDLVFSVKKLLLEPETCKAIGKKAYETIENEWNAEEAAERFLHLADLLALGNKPNYLTGPCSEAE